jgi:ATP-binding cassette subfamily F protein 3
LDVVGVSKAYASQVLLKEVSLRINLGDRVGLVGANGSGKSTLFRLLTGVESPDEGSIQFRRGLTVGLLPQEIDPCVEGTVLDEVLAAVPRYIEVRRAMEELAVSSESWEPQRVMQVTDEYETLGGDSVQTRALALLAGLGFHGRDLHRPLATFSGGWHMRVRLAGLLLAQPDLLLLDEPTNHLDLPSIEWFEGYLKGFKGAYVLVSHDREFLNRTVTRVVEICRGEALQVPGNYDDYRKRKEEVLDHQWRAYEQQQAKVRELEDYIARNRAGADRARQAQSRIKQLEKIELIEPPRGFRSLDFAFPQPPRSGEHVLMLSGVTKTYGDLTVFRSLDLHIRRGEKVAFIGANGAGKSTLLKIAAGLLLPDSGKRELGHEVTPGYFAQHQLEHLVPENSVLEEISTVSRDESPSRLRSLLGAFLFSGTDTEKRVVVLSGGEKSRLALAKLLLRPGNFLILDEPTNHLDIESREVLENALMKFQGTLLFSAHDRRFIERIATRIIEFSPGGLRDFPGNYSYYQWKVQQLAEQDTGRDMFSGREPPTGREPDAGSVDGRRDDRKEKRRKDAELRNALSQRSRPFREEATRWENRVAELESLIPNIEEQLADPQLYATAPDRARDLAADLARSRRALDEALAAWETAEAKVMDVEEAVRREMGQG